MGIELLTTAEAADYLRLKKRKLYELVAGAEFHAPMRLARLFRAPILIAGSWPVWLVLTVLWPQIRHRSQEATTRFVMGVEQGGAGLALPEGSEIGYRPSRQACSRPPSISTISTILTPMPMSLS
jgi:excisionase family DNA binding protein